MTTTAAETMTARATPDGKVTLENAVCVWGLLELPRHTGTYPTGGQRWTVRAVAKLKSDKYGPRVVELTLGAADVGAIYIALQGN